MPRDLIRGSGSDIRNEIHKQKENYSFALTEIMGRLIGKLRLRIEMRTAAQQDQVRRFQWVPNQGRYAVQYPEESTAATKRFLSVNSALGSKTSCYDVEPFLFCATAEYEDLACHFVDSISKEN